MNVNKLSTIERQALFKGKVIAGKSETEAEEEIERDIKFEKDLTFSLKENEKLKREIKKLEDSLSLWKKKYMNLELKQKEVNLKQKETNEERKLHEVKKGDASVQHCNRVINFLKLTEWAGRDEIKKSCYLDYNIDIILNFLMQNGIVIKKEDKSRNGRNFFIYSLKDKMKGGEDEGNTNSN